MRAQTTCLWFASSGEGAEDELPSYGALTSLFTVVNLTRITINAAWPLDCLLTHHFPHLRCLELIAQRGWGNIFCPQSDELLTPLVKPLDVLVDGREERQAARAGIRQSFAETEWNNEDADSEPIIPLDNAANFPSL